MSSTEVGAIAAWNRRSPSVQGEEEGGSAGGDRDLDPKNWEVEVRIDGESVLTIGHSHLSGIPDIDRYGDTVRTCAEHLRSFIGSGEPEPCFACSDAGEVDGCPVCGALQDQGGKS